MAFNEEDWLQLSGLQHFAFCRRQWALIHIENQWAENLRTVDGHLMHEHVHDQECRERRGERMIIRGLAIHSMELGISGQCDAVEFYRDPTGAPLQGREGLWRPYPVEYKRGKPKEYRADEVQLCAQAMCLEEMLCCTVPKGALYYGEPRRRTVVQFTTELRRQVQGCLSEMHELFKKRYTPRVKSSKACNACSLKELCLPKLMSRKKVADYLAVAMEELK